MSLSSIANPMTRFCELSQQQLDLCEDLLDYLYEYRQEIDDVDYLGICDMVKEYYESNEQYHELKKTFKVEQMDDVYKSSSPAKKKHILKGIVITNICISQLNELRGDLDRKLGTNISFTFE